MRGRCAQRRGLCRHRLTGLTTDLRIDSGTLCYNDASFISTVPLAFALAAIAIAPVFER